MTDAIRCYALVRLDGKMSRALQSGKGIKLSPTDLEMLASIGVIGVLSEAKASALEKEARGRQLGQHGQADPASPAAPGDPSAVDDGPRDSNLRAGASSGRLRAR